MRKNPNESIKLEFNSARNEFQKLLNLLSDDDFRKKSHNPGWNNNEILFHMLFGFMIIIPLISIIRFFGKKPKKYSAVFSKVLNSSTSLFNWINAIGARGGGMIFKRHALSYRFYKTIEALNNKLDSVSENELKQGMYYPLKWDSLFAEYMTLEKLFRYPIAHFKFHKKQIRY